MDDMIERIRTEIDGFYAIIADFPKMPIQEVFLALAGISGRVSEIRTVICRMESRGLQAVRTKELEPLLQECDRQFRVYSRLLSVQQQEWDVHRGL